MWSVKNADAIWSLNTVLTASSWHARDSRSAEIPSRILRKSVYLVRPAVKMWSSARRKKDGSIMDVKTTRNVISCPGRDRQQKSARNVAGICFARAIRLFVQMQSADIKKQQKID